MIKELRLATGCGDAKAHVQMEKKTWQSENWEESKARTKVRSLWSDVCLLYLWKKKFMMMWWLGSGINTTRLLICGLDTNNKLYSTCKSCLWRLLGTLLSTRNLLINYKYFSLTKGRRIFFLTVLIIKKLRFFKKSTTGINFIQVKIHI